MTVIRCLVRKEKRGGHHQKKLADAYGRVLEIVTKQSIGNVKEFVEHWSPEMVLAEKDGLGSDQRGERNSDLEDRD